MLFRSGSHLIFTKTQASNPQLTRLEVNLRIFSYEVHIDQPYYNPRYCLITESTLTDYSNDKLLNVYPVKAIYRDIQTLQFSVPELSKVVTQIQHSLAEVAFLLPRAHPLYSTLSTLANFPASQVPSI